jgi:hypothetical protein
MLISSQERHMKKVGSHNCITDSLASKEEDEIESMEANVVKALEYFLGVSLGFLLWMCLLYLRCSRLKTGPLGGKRLRTDIAGEQSDWRGLASESSPVASLTLR